MAKTDNPPQRRATKEDATAGKRIRSLRLAAGISQTVLAKRLGLTFQQVQKYEKGVNRVSGRRVQQLAEIFEVSPGYFFGKTKERADDEVDGVFETKGEIRIIRALRNIKDHARRDALIALAESLVDH